jgi:hypothetical protein
VNQNKKFHSEIVGGKAKYFWQSRWSVDERFPFENHFQVSGH